MTSPRLSPEPVVVTSHYTRRVASAATLGTGDPEFWVVAPLVRLMLVSGLWVGGGRGGADVQAEEI